MFKQRLDFTIQPTTCLTFLVALACVFLLAYAPDTWAYENGLLENLQMILLMLGMLFCITARADKSLYLFFACILFFMMLREVNCGRMLFWSRNGEFFYSGLPADYLKWKEIPHGTTIRSSIYAAISLLCVAALCRRGNFAALKKTLLHTQAPFWELILMLIAVLSSITAERLHICFVTEEVSELLLYTALASAIFRYSRVRQPQILP